MKFRLIAATLCAAGVAAPAIADNAADIKAAIKKAQKAYNSCDVEAMKGLTSEKSFAFNMDGSLTEGNDMADLKAACDAGTKFDLPLNVAKMHVGNDWAVAAGTYKGTVTPGEGKVQNIDAHFTLVLVKDGDGWKSIHFHDSPNIKPQKATE